MAINFPTPTTVGQTYTDPTSGSTYVCVALGPPAQWVGSGSSTSLDNTFLRKDGSNDPYTGQLEITPSTDVTGLVVTQASGNTAAAMRITNEGSGLSLLIEDSSSPDSSPVAVDDDGILIVGTTQSTNIGSSVPALCQINFDSTTIGQSITRHSTSAGAATVLAFGRSKGATVGSVDPLVNGDEIGELRFTGADGTDIQSISSQIVCKVSDTVASNSVPGSIEVRTTGLGEASPSRRWLTTGGGAVRHDKPVVFYDGIYFTADNNWQTIGTWNNSGNRGGAANFLILVSNHAGATNSKDGVYHCIAYYNGTVGPLTKISGNAGLSFFIQQSGSDLQVKSFDSGTGLTTAARVTFIFNDGRVHLFA